MFGRRTPKPLRQPGEITVADLERFGSHSYDARKHPWPEVWTDFVGPVYFRYHGDEDTFLALLADLAERHGGWTAYGADRLMFEIVAGEVKGPACGRILDASIEFLRRSGVAPLHITGYEWNHWIGSGGNIDSWVRRRPEPAKGPGLSLGIGQVHRLAQLFETDDSNVFLVERTVEDIYSWIVDAPESDDDPTRRQWVGATAGSLHELYIKIGMSLQVAPYWCDFELEPYCPLPRPPF